METAQPGVLERLGEWLEGAFQRIAVFLYLMTDLTWSAATGLVRKSGVRRGSFVEQGWAIGSQGLPIIALILFLVERCPLCKRQRSCASSAPTSS